jgi:acyl-CoA synthetase (AMP-forming)/AMP-acid ligase II
MTEAAHQMTSNPLPPAKRKPGSVGPGQGVEVAILDTEGNHVRKGGEGEICVRGENVTKGYLNNEKANKESFTSEGWFRTGDQGKLDDDAYVIITGRIKELIIRALASLSLPGTQVFIDFSGENIAPVEIDGILLSHKAVAEAVCFGVPDEIFGQEIHAAVVLKQGSKVTEKELQSYVAEKVTKFKVPKKVVSFGYRKG